MVAEEGIEGGVDVNAAAMKETLAKRRMAALSQREADAILSGLNRQDTLIELIDTSSIKDEGQQGRTQYILGYRDLDPRRLDAPVLGRVKRDGNTLICLLSVKRESIRREGMERVRHRYDVLECLPPQNQAIQRAHAWQGCEMVNRGLKRSEEALHQQFIQISNQRGRDLLTTILPYLDNVSQTIEATKTDDSAQPRRLPKRVCPSANRSRPFCLHLHRS